MKVCTKCDHKGKEIMYMLSPLKIEIDQTKHKNGYLFRYHIEYESKTCSSCFCYDTFDEAFEKAGEYAYRMVKN
jgi:hypothetical protein